MSTILHISAPVWSDRHPVERKLIATKNGRIARILPDSQGARPPGTRVWNDDCLLVPGFHDAHAHLLMGGLQLGWCHFTGVTSLTQFSDVLHDYLRAQAKEIRWIQGNGLNEATLQVFRGDLDRVCPELPVLIWTHDLHSAVVNSKALEIAGVGEIVDDPPAGRFERDASGRLNGVLRESAAHLIARHIPSPTSEEARHALLSGQAHAFSLGVTAVSSSERAEGWPHYLDFCGSSDHKIRINIWRVSDQFEFERDRFSVVHKYRFRAATLKGFTDGALGSRSAAMWNPYDDDSANVGILSVNEGKLARWVRSAHREGFQIALHAIGDRANSTCLDAIEMASSSGCGPEFRPRIEHAQLLREQDIPRFAQLGVIASMQPIHCTADMLMVEPRIGQARAQYSYAWRSLLESGAVLAFGSDWPVETLDPLAGIHAAVTRSSSDGTPPGGWIPAQRITCEQALRAYTQGSAYAAFWEDEVGEVAEGKAADLVVLSTNILQGNPQDILKAKVVATYAGGELVYRAGD